MRKNNVFLCICVLILLLLLCSCAKELMDQTPLYAASNAIRFANDDSFAQFRGMFDSQSERNATEGLLQSLRESSTSSAAHETSHFVTMDNGDVWLFRFSPAKENEAWKITSIQKLSLEDAETINSLLGNR